MTQPARAAIGFLLTVVIVVIVGMQAMTWNQHRHDDEQRQRATHELSCALSEAIDNPDPSCP